MNTKKIILCLTSMLLIVGCQHQDGSSSSNNESSTSSQESLSSMSSEELVSSGIISSSEELTKMTLVTSIAMPESFVEFKSNSKGETQNERSKFMELNHQYLVGDDNSFKCKPEALFMEVDPITLEATEIDVENWQYSINVSLKEDDKLIAIDSQQGYIDEINDYECLVDFSEFAIGKSFVIDVTPSGLTDKQQSEIEKWTMQFDVSVIDGYNVYDAKELAYINNATNNLSKKSSNRDINVKEIWDSFKTKNDLKLEYYPETLILQQNIIIKNEDIPDDYFFTDKDVAKSDFDYDRVIGTLKDWNGIYNRKLNDEEKFNIYGNYFHLDASNISLVIRDGMKPVAEGDTIISHATLFLFEGSDKSYASLNDLNLLGNSPRQEQETLSGGLIMNKVNGPQLTAKNNIAICWFITFFSNYSKTTYLIEKCRAYDNFNSFIYNYGGSDVQVKESELIGAGGPVIIQDHANHDSNGQGGFIPSVSFVNSNIASYVSGDEGWFRIVGASALVPQVKALDAIFNTVGRSFLKTNTDSSNTFFNLICVNKSGKAETVTASKIQGNVTISNENTNYSFNYGKDNPVVQALCYNDQLLSAGAPIFETSTGGCSYFNGQGLVDAFQQPITSPTDLMFSGDYMCIYSSGMELVFGYGAMGEIYSK